MPSAASKSSSLFGVPTARMPLPIFVVSGAASAASGANAAPASQAAAGWVAGRLRLRRIAKSARRSRSQWHRTTGALAVECRLQRDVRSCKARILEAY